MVRSGRRDFKKKCGRLKCEVAVRKNSSPNVGASPYLTLPANLRGTRKRPPLPSPLLQRRRGRLLRVGAYYKQATPNGVSITNRAGYKQVTPNGVCCVRGFKVRNFNCWGSGLKCYNEVSNTPALSDIHH